MNYGDYKDQSVALALWLVNSRPVGRWPEELPDLESLRRWLAHSRLEGLVPGGPTDRDVVELRAVRDRIVPFFLTDDEDEAAAVVNGLIADTGAEPRVTNHDGAWHVHYDSEEESWSRRMGAIAAMGLATILCEAGLDRLGTCADDDCDSFFVDASKNASRRFCSDRCATRSGVAAYRARARARKEDA